MLEFEEKTEGGRSILYLDGTLDLDGLKQFKDKIGETRKKGSMTIIANFEKVLNVQAAHLQQLVPPIRALTAIGGTMAFCCMNKGVNRTMQTAMFFQLIKVFETEEEAVAELMT